MPKYNANYIGFSTDATLTKAEGIWNLFQQFKYQLISSWPTSNPGATGGTIVDSGGYRYHFFTADATFGVTGGGPLSVDYLVVGGGGGGAADPPVNYGAGGGGAGGFRTGSATIPAGTNISVTIGSGGAAGVDNVSPRGQNGGNSTIGAPLSITSQGGGGGVPGHPSGPNAVNPGGSGGGVGYGPTLNGGNGNTPPTTPPQGNPGGSGIPSPGSTVPASGGGGAGAAGDPACPTPTTLGGRGGLGAAAFSGDTNIPASYGDTNPGSPGRWFSGGGGGGCPPTQTPAPTVSRGGIGGGGRGSCPAGVSTVGQVNTGGGGGGGHYDSSTREGKNGGSGIVIFKYLLT